MSAPSENPAAIEVLARQASSNHRIQYQVAMLTERRDLRPRRRTKMSTVNLLARNCTPAQPCLLCRSVRLRPGILDDLRPLLSFVSEQCAKIGRGTFQWKTRDAYRGLARVD